MVDRALPESSNRPTHLRAIYAFMTLTQKLGVGVGGTAALGTAELFGYSPQDAVHDDAVLWGVSLTFLIIPACLMLLSTGFVFFAPLTQARLRLIQVRLARRAAAVA